MSLCRKPFQLTTIIIYCCLILIASVSASHSSLNGARCEALLDEGREEILKRFQEGADIHRAPKKTFELDEQSLNDLEFMESIFPWLSKSIVTSLGKEHLKWRVRNPSLDPVDIRNRQIAVQSLLDNESLRNDVRSLFEKIAKREQKITSIVSKIKQLSEPQDSLMKWAGRFVNYGLPVMGYGISGLGMASGEGASLFPVILLGTHNYRFQSQSRNNLAVFKEVFSTARRLAPQLLKSESQYLRQIGEILDSVNSGKHPFKIKKTSDFVRRLIVNPVVIARALDTFFISNLTLPRHSAKVRAELHKIAIIGAALAELESFLAFGDLKDTSGLVFPEILEQDAPFTLSVRKGHHPYFYKDEGLSVPNDLNLQLSLEDSRIQVQFLTGPNTRGKSTYLRMIGILALLAQIGAPVPAESMRITPTLVLTNVKNLDSVEDKESTFFAESRRMAQLIKKSETYRHALFIMDEIFVGTSTEEQFAAEEAVIRWIVEQGHFALIASHKRGLSSLEGRLVGFKNYHASDSDEQGRKYTIEIGPSKRRNAFEVMEEAGIPKVITGQAARLFHDNYGEEKE